MPEAPIDPRWPKLLSLSVHEFRTPMTVVAGYIRMLLKDRAGPLTDPQRRLLEEAEKSCTRLSALLAEVSELANLEAGTAPYNRQPLDLRAILRDAAAQVPPLPDREVEIRVSTDEGHAPVEGDPTRLKAAFAAVFAALRRELVTSDYLSVVERRTGTDGHSGFEVLIGDDETVAALGDAKEWPVFDEWRGGSGLSLAVARRVLNAHGGSLSGAPGDRKAGARIVLPAVTD
jgi:signal transduction histidine kinase